jgi:hypothetical protein
VPVLAEHERRSQFLFICLREAINCAATALFDKNANWIERDMSYDPPPSLFGELLTSSACFGEVKISITKLCTALKYLFAFICYSTHFFITSLM